MIILEMEKTKLALPEVVDARSTMPIIDTIKYVKYFNMCWNCDLKNKMCCFVSLFIFVVCLLVVISSNNWKKRILIWNLNSWYDLLMTYLATSPRVWIFSLNLLSLNFKSDFERFRSVPCFILFFSHFRLNFVKTFWPNE